MTKISFAQVGFIKYPAIYYSKFQDWEMKAMFVKDGDTHSSVKLEFVLHLPVPYVYLEVCQFYNIKVRITGDSFGKTSTGKPIVVVNTFAPVDAEIDLSEMTKKYEAEKDKANE